jgi:hypothetical protein
VAEDNLEPYYKALGLASEASFPEVKRAYRALVKTWHPDRFAQAPHLQPQALEKIQLINRAYTKIRQASPPPRPPVANRQRPAPTAAESTWPGAAAAWRLGHCIGASGVKIFPWAVALVAFVTLRLFIIHALPCLALWLPPPSTSPAAVLSAPRAVPQPVGVQERSLASILVEVYTAPRQDTLPADHAAAGVAAQPDSRPAYFTVGSTQAEVLAVQGPPTYAEAHLWEYGGSRVYFRHGRVTRWEAWPRSPLKARLQPGAAVVPTPAYITIGSSKDEVLAIQGTPTRFTDRVWEYGGSRIYFDSDRVTRWDEWRGSPLKARLHPAEAG